MAHKTDAEIIATTHNTARFFTEVRHISWVLLIATMFWGVYGYLSMPQRKDPDIPVRQALAICYWPGANAERIEDLITRRMEEEIGKNAKVEKIESTSRTGVVFIIVTLDEAVKDRAKEFDDIRLKLDAIGGLPQGAGPIRFVKDFGDTAALMLTVASPKVGAAELSLRARSLRRVIEETRADTRPVRTAASGAAGKAQTQAQASASASAPASNRVSLVIALPPSLDPQSTRTELAAFVTAALEAGVVSDPRPILRAGFVGVDVASSRTDEQLLAFTQQFIQDSLRASEFQPDAWPPIAIRDPAQAEARLAAVAGDKYTYRELDNFTDLISRTLKTLPIVAKIDRSGLLQQQVYLDYSQERLASYGVSPSSLSQVLAARNITVPGGILEVQNKSLTIDASGEFTNEREIGDVLIPARNQAQPLYLRDLVTIVRGYATPPSFLNFFARRDADGAWRRTRAVTLSIQMKAGGQISEFAASVDRSLDELRQRLPEDLVLARTSDQPRQVNEIIHLFMRSLEEAIVLVVLVSLVGFWEWRSALLMALSIPITLAMTFGMMHALGIDLQQVSIASLIIALGLLVDDPVVAGDAIKRDLGHGHPPIIAAWLGPTKLATAIVYATITNIVAYLPFLTLPGDTGTFLYSLPVVVTCSLVASRIVSMTFIPLLGYYLVKARKEPTIQERRQSGFAARYARLVQGAIAHRWIFLACTVLLLVLGGLLASGLRSQFFPHDLQYLSYVDVWLPEDAPLSATRATTDRVEQVIRDVSDELAKEEAGPGATGTPRPVLRSLTSFLGGGAPRFWFSVTPEQSQVNYAQVLIEVYDTHDTSRLIDPLQRALTARVPGARADVRQLETGPPVGIPVAIRISGEDVPTLRQLAGQAKQIFERLPIATRTRDNWGIDSFSVRLRIDPDRANLAGITNMDVAASSASGMNGVRAGVLREADKQIPIVARMRMEERAQLGDVQNLYVYSQQGPQKVPLSSISSVEYATKIEKRHRRNQFRAITVSTFPEGGYLPSDVLTAVRPQIDQLAASLPPGFRLEIGGEYEEQVKGFKNQSIVMLMSVAMIFLALVVQFKHAIKPFIVFAAIPFGMVGALASLSIMGAPFGFMAFLGVASLVGVIVSHIIVLFDFIEEARERGEPLIDALIDAGIVRLRPVLITVAATVIALFPLARNGGPLWEPLCYAQIGGLTVATFVTLILVPVIYSLFVLDLKWVAWKPGHGHEEPAVQPGAEPAHQ
jgi:multidrug efflux pump subunit AcrB